MGWFSGSKRELEHRALPASDAPRRQPRSRPGGTILGELHPLTETMAEQGVKRFSPILVSYSRHTAPHRASNFIGLDFGRLSRSPISRARPRTKQNR